MVNCCCLPNCRSGSRVDRTTSVFRAPRDPSAFEKWSVVVKKFDVDLKPHHYICEKHFLNEDILREKVIRDSEGRIIFQRKFDKIRLRHGAVPFASAPSLTATIKNLTPTDPVKNDEIADKSVKFESVEQNKTSTVFDDIYNGIFKLELPDLSWGIHMCEEPIKCITVSQIAKCSDTDKLPAYTKQITLNENLHLKLFVLHSKVVERAATTVQEVQSTLEKLCNVQLCEGGPVIGSYRNVHPYCAYKDVITDRWRHNLCSLVTERSDVCSNCRLLDKILRIHLDRKDKSRKLRIMMSPISKKKIDIMRKAHRVQMQAFRRSKRKIQVIKSEVKELQKKVNEISEATFEESINKLNLPHAQVRYFMFQRNPHSLLEL